MMFDFVQAHLRELKPHCTSFKVLFQTQMPYSTVVVRPVLDVFLSFLIALSENWYYFPLDRLFICLSKDLTLLCILTLLCF